MADRPLHYILVGRMPIAVDLMTWARWVDKLKNRRLLHTVIDAELDVFVLTIFHGLDSNFDPEGDPILFETMAFVPAEKILLGRVFNRESLDFSERRYCTYKQAEAGHAEVVAQVSAWLEEMKAAASIELGAKHEQS